MTKGHMRGHAIEFVNDEWVYPDNKQPTATTHRDRDCGHCGEHQTIHGHDSCIGQLPGVANACCGHGSRGESYIMFENGVTVRGFTLDNK